MSTCPCTCNCCAVCPQCSPGTATFNTPGQALNIGTKAGQNYFNVGLGISGNGHIDYGLAEIANGFTKQGYFELNSDRTGVRFTAHLDGGVTSKNTHYPRSELRELTAKGERAAWDAAKGNHTMLARLAAFHTAPKRPNLCLAQIHDDEDDTLQVRIEGKRLFVTVGGKDAGTLEPAYTMGVFFDLKVQATGKRVTVTYNGAKKVDKPFTGAEQYFKIGAYAQSNKDYDLASETCAMEVLSLAVTHS